MVLAVHGMPSGLQKASTRMPMLATNVMIEANAATSRMRSVMVNLLFRNVSILFSFCAIVKTKNEGGTILLNRW
jgi:hypothetical protein